MDFENPQDYMDVLKRLEGFPLMGLEVKDGHLFLHSISRHVALPLRRARGDLTLCVCARPDGEDKDGNRPVVAYKIDWDTLDREELSFNVI